MPPSSPSADFVVVEPLRTCCDHYARPLDAAGRLRLLTIGTRRGVEGVRAEVTRTLPALGLAAYAACRTLPAFQAESFRFRLHPWIDRWARRQLRPGDHVLSSYGYANRCFEFARAHGGRTFLDAGNSHPDNFWQVMQEELSRWGSPFPPVARHHYERSLAMLPLVDFVLAPSSFVARSFVDRGFDPARIFRGFYPVDLHAFARPTAPRPRNRPLTVISTGRLSLRKGTPYLLEAFRLIRQRHPSVRLLLTRDFESNVQPVLARSADLPIEWSPTLPHPALAERLRSADVFVLPSLEEGFVQTAAEALACGLPVVLTPNTGTADLVEPGRNGSVVPLRDPAALATAVLEWGDRILAAPDWRGCAFDAGRLSPARFAEVFLGWLATLEIPH